MSDLRSSWKWCSTLLVFIETHNGSLWTLRFYSGSTLDDQILIELCFRTVPLIHLLFIRVLLNIYIDDRFRLTIT